MINLVLNFRDKLSLLLNPEKVLRTEDGHYRDWRGLFTLSDLTQSEFSLISENRDKTRKLLELWLKRNKDNIISINHIQECLGLIDRYDVYDDTFILFSKYIKFRILVVVYFIKQGISENVTYDFFLTCS